MPELPEVQTVLKGLTPVMKGFRILSVEQNRPNLRYPFPEKFVERLSGSTILDMFRRAKYIILNLDTNESLILHLGMSGRVQIHSNEYVRDKHDHVVFHMSNDVTISYNDPRRFGLMDFCSTENLGQYKSFKSLGPEPMGAEFTPEYLMLILKDKITSVKSALLDQALVAGLGNIYVCEALFMARIDPKREAHRLTKIECHNLIKAIQDVLDKAIKAGGSTLRDHQQPSGELGYFQHNFLVYGRNGQSCFNCMAPIWRIQQAGRSTFYCSQCQI